MRQRTKMGAALCSHTTPQHSYMGRHEVLSKKFNSGEISIDELRELASFRTAQKNTKPSTVTVKVWGKPTIVSYSEYLIHYKPYGF